MGLAERGSAYEELLQNGYVREWLQTRSMSRADQNSDRKGGGVVRVAGSAFSFDKSWSVFSFDSTRDSARLSDATYEKPYFEDAQLDSSGSSEVADAARTDSLKSVEEQIVSRRGGFFDIAVEVHSRMQSMKIEEEESFDVNSVSESFDSEVVDPTSFLEFGSKADRVTPRIIEAHVHSGFSVFDSVTPDGSYGLGTTVTCPQGRLDQPENPYLRLVGLAELSRDPEYQIHGSYAMMSRVSCNGYAVIELVNGFVLVTRMTDGGSRMDLDLHARGDGLTNPGPLMRRFSTCSLTNCATCTPRGRYCRCSNSQWKPLKVETVLPTFHDVTDFYMKCGLLKVQRAELLDHHGSILESSLYIMSGAMAAASSREVALYQALLLPEFSPQNKLDRLLSQEYALTDGRSSGPDECEDVSHKKADLLSIRCDACGKMFTRRSNMERHRQTVHGGVRLFPCESCDASFKAKETLDKHIRFVHIRADLHQCNMCDRKFTRVSNLNRHMRDTHEKLQRFNCRACDRVFNTRFNLERHSKRHHDA